MLLVLSPAKTLDFDPPPAELPATAPRMAKETARLARIARRLKRRDLMDLMGISEALAELNVARFRAFQRDPAPETGVQAALAFAGDVYRGLKPRELDARSLEWAQEHVRILSGLYGLLRPLDRIQPYRLEMGVKLNTPRGDSLYDYWGDRIAKALRSDASDHTDPTIVNLASQEYFRAVNVKALKRPVVTCTFKQAEADGTVRHIALFAKVARGLMARHAIDHRIETAAGLKSFDREGYGFRPDLSTEVEWVFGRARPQ